ncbi:Kazal-type serine protease inhibitor family protein [Nannocystis punicea]|uniref:Kazal-type serine protease inhibitor n=1 Tax=Nannocystis punicea TaxID=2995304 RepID=A0ABY7H859_9BACT|nr:Kazal-type serine protease inhibitor [Nannocystis poenicansa]WAS95184.1 Kazal-type serine protease inhibitor [Nannocystis poenicansa]
MLGFILFTVIDITGQADADRIRIQQHLETVETELRARDTSHLPPALQAERARNLDRLHTYQMAGLFPRNPEFIGERVPFFIDEDGVACAVGHLVIESGFADVAGEIAARENNARLLDMTHPALSGWIAQSGLTAEECARIQPTYCGCGDEYAPVCGVDGQTYGNACYAETCANVAIAHEGACKAEESTSDWPDAGTSTGPGDSTGSDSTGSETTGEEPGSSSGSGSAGEPHEAAERKGGCSLGQERAGAPALALLLLLAARRRRARS